MGITNLIQLTQTKMITVKATLFFPEKESLLREEVICKIEGKDIPCLVMPSTFWDRLPNPLPLPGKSFKIKLTEEEWESYLDFHPVFRIEEKECWDCIEEIQSDSRLKHLNKLVLRDSFIRFWNADQRTEYVCDSLTDAANAVSEIMEEFITDCLSDEITIYQEIAIRPDDEIAEKVAKECGLEVVYSKPKISTYESYSYRWIDLKNE